MVFARPAEGTAAKGRQRSAIFKSLGSRRFKRPSLRRQTRLDLPVLPTAVVLRPFTLRPFALHAKRLDDVGCFPRSTPLYLPQINQPRTLPAHILSNRASLLISTGSTRFANRRDFEFGATRLRSFLPVLQHDCSQGVGADS